MMDLPLLALALLSACSAPGRTAPGYCTGNCPQYTVVEQNADFEERSYAPAGWITTDMDGSSLSDFMAARSRLANAATDADTWPVLLTVTDGNHLSYSWFVPQESAATLITDPAVRLWSRPAVTDYVRAYDDSPSIENSRDNAKLLYADLEKAGKSVVGADSYTWAGYSNYVSLTHHNEIWMEKTQ